MYLDFKNSNGKRILLKKDSVLAVISDPNFEPCEVRLSGGEKVLVTFEVAEQLAARLLESGSDAEKDP